MRLDSALIYLGPKNLDTFWWNCQIIFRWASIHGRADFILENVSNYNYLGIKFTSSGTFTYAQKELVITNCNTTISFSMKFHILKSVSVSDPILCTGARCVRKKNKKKTIQYSLAPIFLSRRVKLIVTSERLNIFKKCFHQSKVK